MKRAWIVLGMLGAQVAHADPKHVLVLRSEGSADAGWRTKVDTQVLKLAKNIDGNVEAGDISYSDAAAAVGCSATDLTCKDEVLSTMGVDEIVVTTVNNSSGGDLSVAVRRFVKGQPTKEATTTIPVGQQPDAKMNADIGPMFGVTTGPPPPPEPPPPPAPPPPQPTTPPVPPPESATPPAPPPTTTASANPEPTTEVTAAPNGQVAEGGGGHTLEVAGMIGGGALVVLGIVMWAEASSTQGDINSAPVNTPKDFQHLQDLESTGDTYAALGNVSFVAGLAVGALAGYFYWRDVRADHAAQHARVTPTVFPHGAGVALTFGAAP
ncbi:MAG TPA: hypothetical protein VLX92_14110 [Kofleriaceae bacterium]|nr:hypothetical protein [Kofleriaceae bacterium]